MATLRFAFSFLILAAAFYGFAEFLSDRWPLNNPMHVVESVIFGLFLIVATWLLVDYTVRCILRHKRKQKLAREAENRSAREWDEAQAKLIDQRGSSDRKLAAVLSGCPIDFDGPAIPELMVEDARTPA